MDGVAQAAFDFTAPVSTSPASNEAPEMDPDKCENLECKNKHLPGRPMCGECARLFGGYLQGKILGWKNV